MLKMPYVIARLIQGARGRITGAVKTFLASNEAGEWGKEIFRINP